MNKKCQTNFSCARKWGEEKGNSPFREERAASLWNLLSRVPLGGGGGSASLYLLAARGRTSIIFLAAIVMRLGEIPGGRRGWTSTEKNFPGCKVDARRKRNYGSPSSVVWASPDHFFCSDQPSRSLSPSLFFVNTPTRLPYGPYATKDILFPFSPSLFLFFFLIFEGFCSKLVYIL